MTAIVHKPPETSASRFFYGYVIVGAALMILMVSFGVHYAFGVFFKPMSDEFGWSRSMTSGAFSLSWLLHGVSAIFFGRLNDRFGPRRVLILSGLVLAAGYLLTTRVQAAWHFYFSYGILVGLGTGGIYVPLVSTVARWFVANRTTMTGIAVAGAGLGMFFIPLIANQLILRFNWRTTYTLLGLTMLLIVILASLLLKSDPAAIGELPYGLPADGEGYRHTSAGLSLAQALHTRQFWIICVIFFCFGFFTYAIMVHVAPYALDQGLSATSAAKLVAIIGVASIVGKMVLGKIGDRIGNRNIYMACFLATAMAVAVLLTSAQWVLYPFVVVTGLAYGGCSASHSPLIATFFGLKAHGQIIGVANNGYTIGATLGPLVAGYLFDVYGTYHFSFWIVAIVAVTGFLLGFGLKPSRKSAAVS